MVMMMLMIMKTMTRMMKLDDNAGDDIDNDANDFDGDDGGDNNEMVMMLTLMRMMMSRTRMMKDEKSNNYFQFYSDAMLFWATCGSEVFFSCLDSGSSLLKPVAYSASSYIHSNPPRLADVNSGSAWCAEFTDERQFLQLDLGKVFHVTGVETASLSVSETVNNFTVSTSLYGSVWVDYAEKQIVRVREIPHTNNGAVIAVIVGSILVGFAMNRVACCLSTLLRRLSLGSILLLPYCLSRLVTANLRHP